MVRLSQRQILVIDDNVDVLEMMKKMIASAGYRVCATSDPLSAVDMIKTGGNSIALVVSDINMPGINGIELFKTIMETCPDMKVILCSCGDCPCGDELLSKGLFAYVSKPFRMKDLLQPIREAMKIQR